MAADLLYNDRHFLAAAPLFGLKGTNILVGKNQP